jgi:hypothetical protein
VLAQSDDLERGTFASLQVGSEEGSYYAHLRDKVQTRTLHPTPKHRQVWWTLVVSFFPYIRRQKLVQPALVRINFNPLRYLIGFPLVVVTVVQIRPFVRALPELASSKARSSAVFLWSIQRNPNGAFYPTKYLHST